MIDIKNRLKNINYLKLLGSASLAFALSIILISITTWEINTNNLYLAIPVFLTANLIIGLIKRNRKQILFGSGLSVISIPMQFYFLSKNYNFIGDQAQLLALIIPIVIFLFIQPFLAALNNKFYIKSLLKLFLLLIVWLIISLISTILLFSVLVNLFDFYGPLALAFILLFSYWLAVFTGIELTKD